MGANRSKKGIEPALSRADPGTNIIDVGAVKSWLLYLIEESVRGQSKSTNKQASGARIHKMLGGDLVSRGIALTARTSALQASLSI